jgi:hypothetical protein
MIGHAAKVRMWYGREVVAMGEAVLDGRADTFGTGGSPYFTAKGQCWQAPTCQLTSSTHCKREFCEELRLVFGLIVAEISGDKEYQQQHHAESQRRLDADDGIGDQR